MTKAAPKLTKIQAKALDFIRTSLERSGTAPTLRELCAFMGYSAIGSAQDLVAALRRKGFLHTPDKQSARALILTPKAIALHEPSHQSTENTFVIHGFDELPEGNPLEMHDERSATLRMSMAMFTRPYPLPEELFALKACVADSMIDAGILDGDWLLVQGSTDTDYVGKVVVARLGGKSYVRRLMKDRNGYYLRSENVSYPVLRIEGEDLNIHEFIAGEVIALQRVF